MIYCRGGCKDDVPPAFSLHLTGSGDRIIGEAADLAEENEGGGRVVEKIESFSGMPAKIEKYRHLFCYGIFVSGDFMRGTI